jgi:hypothetical protein
MRSLPRITSLLLFGLAGCLPLPQMEKHPSRIPFHASYNGWGEKAVIFTIGGCEERPKDYEILPQRSHVIDPSGKQHPIRIQPHEFDISEHYPFIRDDIFVLRSAAHPAPISLRDGTWKFVLTYRRASGVRTDTFSFRIWTFYYNPIIHGPPN